VSNALLDLCVQEVQTEPCVGEDIIVKLAQLHVHHVAKVNGAVHIQHHAFLVSLESIAQNKQMIIHQNVKQVPFQHKWKLANANYALF